MRSFQWSDGSGRIEIELMQSDIDAVGRPGDNEQAVATLVADPRIAAQLAEFPVAALADALREYGVWDEAALSDHNANLRRVLWVACWDCADDPGNCMSTDPADPNITMSRRRRVARRLGFDLEGAAVEASGARCAPEHDAEEAQVMQRASVAP